MFEHKLSSVQLNFIISEGELYPCSINDYQRSAAVTDNKIKYKPADKHVES